MNGRFTLTTKFDMETNVNNTTEPQHDAKLPVSGSYLLITKELYSDGVSSVYEETITASSIEHAKDDAFFKVQERNVELSKDGRCFIVDVRSV